MDTKYGVALAHLRHMAAQPSTKSPRVYNDALGNGARSVKVWGWSRSEYMQARTELERMGYMVNVVSVPRRPWVQRGRWRLHIFAD